MPLSCYCYKTTKLQPNKIIQHTSYISLAIHLITEKIIKHTRNIIHATQPDIENNVIINEHL